MYKKTSKKVKNYLSLVKFSHTIFAMPFAFIGYFLALYQTDSIIDWKLLLLVVLCMVFARNAAMAFNRFIDREIDIKNPRTAIREIPAGILKAKSVFIFVIINSILFIATTYFINKLTFHLSPVALIIILGYSITKKFTALCHLILGLGLSLAPIGAYLAVTGEFALLPVLYSLVVLLWVSGFDIIYALQDLDFDKEEELKSLPVFFGRKGALQASSLLHLVSAILTIYAGYYAEFGLFYWIGCLFFIGLLFYQHTLVKPDNLSKVNVAFFTTNGIASVIFAVFTITELILKIWH
ncbi:MAG: 4-hydroxybenzoate octaprenyltransferase [Bacteroidetes bacterium GWC2_33_15]|nr:MAG: 4-hydroxybenzoate octaprenyltransferase [Bacteroidetes bacterium GWA2_33_15]OFX51035.1 MAG: 4-hydroxybenzoate octaprenyltransferase [Bacteroidetes bacterium GWC2_33_15]OFX65658.1 MAG: 4-hydroxybenzoate octaprenyltransferase [Bacteroidetes bacterium GWB2_32_14]OFX70243.1 MAG: 4-hydroxybenzoate octaprenyltransferase [Bacteroidetes bacterium GWD2_33_33]HAN17239.1 4-hydroxybenzoate octaprenyltransferase [Bacteroidales bacterium]